MSQEQNYSVNYSINVEATKGPQQVQAFADAVGKLVQAKASLTPAVNNIKQMMDEIDKTFRTKSGKKRDYTYSIVPYMSPNMKIDSDRLVEETIEYFNNYNLNGITGSLTLFGDLALNTACQVELIDNRNPSKNGIYLVEEVTTTFGTHGYRQKITLPYRIKR